MKVRIIIVALIIFIILFVFIARGYSMHIDTDFASEIAVQYHYIETSIDLSITDIDDIRDLKSILKGKTYKDYPSCGFSLDISITFSDGEKSITLCPACDGCSVLRVNDSDRYIRITDMQRQRFNEILEKYGMIFPCV